MSESCPFSIRFIELPELALLRRDRFDMSIRPLDWQGSQGSGQIRIQYLHGFVSLLERPLLADLSTLWEKDLGMLSVFLLGYGNFWPRLAGIG
jgi:hypothetical protein